MYIYSLENKDALIEAVEHEFKHIGIKQVSKAKVKLPSRHFKRPAPVRTRIFQRPLEQLPQQNIQLHCGAIVQVPCFLVDLCEHIEQRHETEGLFRKAGSAIRQKEIKAHLEAGGSISNDFHEIDVANILKLFLRELPEPLIPTQYHDILVRCKGQSVTHVLLACLLLPSYNLNVLAYLMQFLNMIASTSSMNLMTASNLSIVLVPALMPVFESHKVSDQVRALQHGHHSNIIQILIEQAEHIGELPNEIVVQLGLQTQDEISGKDEVDRASFGSLDSLAPERKTRKRRSGSLTRVLNGLRKIVGRQAASPGVDTNPPDQQTEQSSPCIMSASASKKRRIDVIGGFSTKKKLEVLLSLPEKSVLSSSTPARPCMQSLHISDSPAPEHFFSTPPVCSHPNPQKSITKSPHPQVIKSRQRRFFTPKSRSESLLPTLATNQFENKKQRLSFGNKKSKKQAKQSAPLKVSPDKKTETSLKRKKSWSSLSGTWGRSMRRLAPISSHGTPLLKSPYSTRYGQEQTTNEPEACEGIDLSLSPKTPVSFSDEYEEIKNKVSNLENQLNEEISKAQMARHENVGHSATFVQSEYERTLEDSEPFNNCQTTEHLAKRLSRELKIRRSGENKVIRSPSARKIGSLRRRSRESNKPILRASSLNKISRSPIRSTVPIPNSCGLKRGRPNTVLSGLPSPAHVQKFTASTQSLNVEVMPQPSPVTGKPVEFLVPQSPFTGPVTRSVIRASSFNNMDTVVNSTEIKKSSSFNEEKWFDACAFMKNATPNKQDTIGRPSIAEIKRNRAGMVLASVKLFDHHTSPDIKLSFQESVTKLDPKVNTSCTISPQTVNSPRKLIANENTPVTKNDDIFKTPLRSTKKNTSCTPHSDGARDVYYNAQRKNKVNNSLPGDWFSGKENLTSPPYLRSLKTNISPCIKLPEGLKDTIYDVCTPRSQKLSVKSPLMLVDCNKMESPKSVQLLKTPQQQYPVIKKPLSVRPVVASALRRTSHKLDTPSRAMKPMTPLRRSPRLLAMNFSSSPFIS